MGGGSSEGELGRKYIAMLSSLQLKRASCISQFHLLLAPPPHSRATAGHLPALSVPGVGHLQILHCPGAGHLPTPGPFPSF